MIASSLLELNHTGLPVQLKPSKEEHVEYYPWLLGVGNLLGFRGWLMNAADLQEDLDDLLEAQRERS